MRIIHVTPDRLERAWPHAAPWLAKAHLRGSSRYPLEDTALDVARDRKLLFRCVSGENFCWLVLGCVENSANRTALVYACGGKGVLDMLPDVVSFCEAYAMSNGCQYITCSGRAGWVRELAAYGWDELNRTCGKELHYGQG